MILAFILVQVVIVIVTVGVLRGILEKDLMRLAIEELSRTDLWRGKEVGEVTVLSACQIPEPLENMLQAVVSDRFPGAVVRRVINKEILGGLVCQAGGVLIDFSLSNRLKYLWGGQPS